MGRPEYFTVTVKGPGHEGNPLLFTLRVVDNINALIGPEQSRTNLVDLLDPTENETGQFPVNPRDPHWPWDTIVQPRETKELTREAVVEETIRRLREPLLRALLVSGESKQA